MTTRKIGGVVALLLGLGWTPADAWIFTARGQVAGDRERTETEARGQAAEGDRLFKEGAYAAALPFYRAERSSRATLGDLRYEAYALRAIGCCHERLGASDEAIAAWTEAIAIDARREDHGYEGYDWLLIGNVELRRQQPEEAAVAIEKALPLLATAVDRDHEADARLSMARALREMGRPEDALPHLDRAIALADALDDPKRRTDAWAQSGMVAIATGDPGLAAEWVGDARDAYDAQGHKAEAAAADRLLGDAFLALERADVATARVEDAARVHEQLGDRAGLADDLEFLAGLKAETRDWPAALTLSRRAVAARHADDDPDGEIAAGVQLARFESLGGDWTASARTLEKAVTLVLREGEPADQVRLLILAADVEARAGHAERGTARLDQASRIADRADNGALRAMVAQARVRTGR